MDGLIAVTDFEWFDFLRKQGPLEEVNFWRPSDTRRPQRLMAGAPVIFKLKKRFGNWIVGWGVFARHEVLPAWLAWEAFETRNGAESLPRMRERIERLRSDRGRGQREDGEYPIGCLMLAQPTFLERDEWVAAPRGWPENAVQGKTYNLTTGEGARVWLECQERATASGISADRSRPIAFPTDRYGHPILVKPRLGQGIFRIAVTAAYDRACAVTSEHSLPALEAAHIRPFSDGGPHEVANGLLLRSDLHRLFDKGYVGITPERRFAVSKRLKQDYSNGRSYYPLDGTEVRLPARSEDRPDSRSLEWHYEERFKR